MMSEKLEYSSLNLETTSPIGTPPLNSIKFNHSQSINPIQPPKKSSSLLTKLGLLTLLIIIILLFTRTNPINSNLLNFKLKPSLLSIPSHPIIPLIKSANLKWSILLKSQSTTYEKSTRIYRQKYSLPLPIGYDKWYQFAKQKNHTLIDEYDTLMNDLSPFRALSPNELRRRIKELSTISGISIISIRNGVSQVHSKSGRWAPALAFQEMIAGFVTELPDMDVAINEKPEGRVLPRRERVIIRSMYKMPELEEEFMSESILLYWFCCF